MSKRTSSQISLIALMVANSVPLWGVLFYGWDLFQILFIYWLESAIVGFYNIFKMIIVDKLLSIIFVPLFVSHGVSFFYNFLGKQEYKHVKSGTQMEAPYKRIMVMHATILFGGWLVLFFQNKLYALLILIALKTATDMYAHKKEHA